MHLCTVLVTVPSLFRLRLWTFFDTNTHYTYCSAMFKERAATQWSIASRAIHRMGSNLREMCLWFFVDIVSFMQSVHYEEARITQGFVITYCFPPSLCLQTASHLFIYLAYTNLYLPDTYCTP